MRSLRCISQTVEQPSKTPIIIHQKRSGSGVSRCSIVVYIYPLYGRLGVIGRSNMHRGWGVDYLGGLGCWQSCRQGR